LVHGCVKKIVDPDDALKTKSSYLGIPSR
jgi:hypothetical protein